MVCVSQIDHFEEKKLRYLTVINQVFRKNQLMALRLVKVRASLQKRDFFRAGIARAGQLEEQWNGEEGGERAGGFTCGLD